ncbi:MAG: hypothetical protein F4227_05720 [Gammaproteobacteria bacterium]|nr:hypothetical protein [Gammaproteobacteria bacterium]MYF02464.1 hypothetical protein [Gammaproteobacteria bacterium]MYI77887.1 hypothetical protein [Gammaproteobacteria bacterium]
MNEVVQHDSVVPVSGGGMSPENLREASPQIIGPYSISKVICESPIFTVFHPFLIVHPAFDPLNARIEMGCRETALFHEEHAG